MLFKSTYLWVNWYTSGENVYRKFHSSGRHEGIWDEKGKSCDSRTLQYVIFVYLLLHAGEMFICYDDTVQCQGIYTGTILSGLLEQNMSQKHIHLYSHTDIEVYVQ